jgi:hypothetical protein
VVDSKHLSSIESPQSKVPALVSHSRRLLSSIEFKSTPMEISPTKMSSFEDRLTVDQAINKFSQNGSFE